jgi:hypothetical protein
MKSFSRDGRTVALLLGVCLALQVGPVAAGSKVVRANTPDQIVSAILAANSTDQSTVIRVAPGTYRFGASFDSEFGPSVLPPIKAHVFLYGEPGSDPATTVLTRSSGVSGARMITVVPGGRLVVRNMTITGGAADEFTAGLANGGGAAGNFGGFLRFEDCAISRNTSGGFEGPVAAGGAILSVDGRLELERTTVSDNFVFNVGGGIALVRGSGEIRDSIISRNLADVSGGGTAAGGIYVSAGAILGFYGSTIAGNIAVSVTDDLVGQGGGIFNQGTVWITNSAVVGNSTSPGEDGAGSGGGIFNAGVMRIENGTVSGNIASTSGGGIYNRRMLTLRGVTVVNNEALGRVLPEGFGLTQTYPPGCGLSTPDLCIAGGGGVWNEPSGRIGTSRTVFAGNVSGLGPDCGGTFLSQGHNAVGDGTDCKLKPAIQGGIHDLINIDPRLAAFVDNGEPGKAHFPLRADSPLIDAGGAMGTFCTFLDQIGQRRVDGDREGNFACDIGAIEFQPN